MTKENFEAFLLERNDAVDNAAYQFLLLLRQNEQSGEAETVLPWSMELIGELVEQAQSILHEASFPNCWPFYENEIPCMQTDSCKNPNCPFHENK